jgi:hypothetical protein
MPGSESPFVKTILRFDNSGAFCRLAICEAQIDTICDQAPAFELVILID